MTNTKLRLHETMVPLLFALAASAALSLDACKGDDVDDDNAGDVDDENTDGDTIEVSEDIVNACQGYCAKLADCNEETVAEECEKQCEGVLYACEEHQPGEAIDQVNQCAGEDCLAFPACTANAGVQCLTGLGF